MPVGTKDLYEAVSPWSDFGAILEEGEAFQLSVSPNTLNFAAGGGEGDIQIVSNINWTVTRAGTSSAYFPWLTVTPTAGSGNSMLHLTAAPNTSATVRKETLVISSGGLEQEVIVTQEAASPLLTVSPTSIGFGAGGEQNIVQVASNTNWSVVRADDASWLTVTPTGASGNGTVFIAAIPNTGATARRGTLTVSGGGIEREIVVTQEAQNSSPPATVLTVSPETVSLAANGGTQSLTVTSGTNWTAISPAAWLTVSPTSGTGDGTVTLSATANTDATRTATVTLTGGGVTCTVSVTQAAAGTLPPGYTLTVSPERLDFPYTGNSQSLAITTKRGWSIARSDAWLITVPIGGVGSGTVTVVTTPNKGSAARTGTLTLTCDDASQVVISVTQASQSDVANETVDAADIRYALDLLTVNTPAAERITVYSLSGAVMYRAQKTASPATFDLSGLPKGVFIIRGSSGWTEKVIK